MARRPPEDLTDQIVLLHGFTGAGASWGASVGALARRRIGAIAPDLPGHGSGAVVPPGDGISLDDALDVIEGAVQEAIRRAGGRPPVLLGYSMGGRLAFHFAHRSPRRLRGLVLESASPGLATEEERSTRAAADTALAHRIREIGVEAFSEEWGRLPLFRSQDELSADVRAAVERQRRASSASGLAAALEGLGTGTLPSLWDALETVDVPTLILAGGLDEKFADIGRTMHARLPHSRLTIVDGAGHRVHLERPDAWLEAVATFDEELREAE